MTVQNHYKVLGVLDTAEVSVIKAAYKALVQIYHPDKFNTLADKEAATAKVKQINEAYRVLSDPKLREAYDRELASQNDAYDEEVKQEENTNEYRQKNHALDQSWDFAKQFVENLDGIYESLALISNDLAFTFKLIIIDTKNFDNAKRIASRLESDYLEKFFGSSIDLQKFAKWLLLKKRRDVALEANKAVKVLGVDFDSKKIIKTLCTKYELDYLDNSIKENPSTSESTVEKKGTVLYSCSCGYKKRISDTALQRVGGCLMFIVATISILGLVAMFFLSLAKGEFALVGVIAFATVYVFLFFRKTMQIKCNTCGKTMKEVI